MCLAKLLKGYVGWSTLSLRLVIAAIFLFHGSQKLFGAFEGPGIAGTAGFFGNVGIPLPLVAAWLVALVEFFGGLAVLLGLFTRYAAVLLSCVMVVAILTVHLKNGFSGQGGYEFALMVLAGTVSLLLSGPGKASLEKTLWKKEL